MAKRIKKYQKILVKTVREFFLRLNKNNLGNSLPVFIFGAQRSGTTMLGECLDASPEIKHYPEHDKHAFDNFMLKDDSIINELIDDCPFKLVVFKPLTDSHRVDHLINEFSSGKAIWMYRRYENRATSAVQKFGNHNLGLMKDFSQEKNLDIWQAKGLRTEDIDLIKSFEPDTMTPETAAVLFWYIRNQLFFSQKLENNKNVILVSYEGLVRKPEDTMRAISNYLGCEYNSAMASEIHANSLTIREVKGLGKHLKSCGDDMYSRLQEAQKNQNVVPI